VVQVGEGCDGQMTGVAILLRLMVVATETDYNCGAQPAGPDPARHHQGIVQFVHGWKKRRVNRFTKIRKK
jgi:hypothetical protein